MRANHTGFMQIFVKVKGGATSYKWIVECEENDKAKRTK